MNPIRTLIGCGLLLGAFAPAWAETAAEAVGVEAPYVRAVPPSQRNSAAFMRLHNGGDQAHALTGARSPVAEAVEKGSSARAIRGAYANSTVANPRRTGTSNLKVASGVISNSTAPMAATKRQLNSCLTTPT